MFTMAPQFDGVSVTVDDFPDANMKTIKSERRSLEDLCTSIERRRVTSPSEHTCYIC